MQKNKTAAVITALSIIVVLLCMIQYGKRKPYIDLPQSANSARMIDRGANEQKIGIDRKGNFWLKNKRIDKENLEETLLKEYPPENIFCNDIAIMADQNSDIRYLLFLTTILEKGNYKYGLDIRTSDGRTEIYSFDSPAIDKNDIPIITITYREKKVTAAFKGNDKIITDPDEIFRILKKISHISGESLVIIQMEKGSTCQELVNILDRCPSRFTIIRIKEFKNN